MHATKRLNYGRTAVAAALSFGLAFAQAPIALAEEAPKKDIKQLSDEITQLYIEAEQSQYDLITAQQRLGKTEELISELDAKIAETESKLNEAKADLSGFVSADYKQGTASLLDIILNSKSFDHFISQVVYANKVAEHQRNAINTVDELYSDLTLHKAEMEKAKAEQEQLAAEEQQSQVAVQQADQVAQDFIAALPEDVLVQLASEDEASREAATAASLEILSNMDQSQLESAFGAEAAQAISSGEVTVSDIMSGGGGASSSDGGSSSEGSGSSSGSGGSSSGSTTATYSGASDFLSRVYSLLGSGYQYSGYNYTGSSDSSAFTCSGVVDYALGNSSRTNSPETLYEAVGTNLTTDVSSLQAGDLVFYSYGNREVGHVGVYVGDGQVIDSIPNGGVAVRDVNYMDVVGGGSLGGTSSSSSSSSSSTSSASGSSSATSSAQ